MKKHFDWIDYAKTFAIFLVVLVHVNCNATVNVLINATVIPLFLTLSGFLFSYQRNPSPCQFTLKRFRRLIIPYLWIGAISYVAWIAFLRNYGSNPHDQLPWHEPLIGMLAGIPNMLSHDIPLWSLVSFFVVEIIYYPLGRLIKNDCVIITLSWSFTLACYIFIPSIFGNLPLALGPSICGLGFYACGRILRKTFDNNKRRFDKPFSYPLIALYIIAYPYVALNNGYLSFYICRYNNFALFLTGAIIGSLLVIGLSMHVASLIGTGKESLIIRMASKGTLLICGFHLLVFAVMKGVMLFVFGVSPERLSTGVIHGTIFALCGFLLCLP